MATTIKVNDKTKERLNEIKEEEGYISFDDVINHILDTPKEPPSDFSLESLNVEELAEKKNLEDSVELVLSEEGINDDSKDIKVLFDDEDLEKKTDLNKLQVMALSKARTFANRYDSKVLNDFINHYITFSISKDRKGRKEFVESLKVKVLEPLGLGGGFGGKAEDEDR